jgi:hypothetical protein
MTAVPGLFKKARPFHDAITEVLTGSDWYHIDRRGKCVRHCPASLEHRRNRPDVLEVTCRRSGFNKVDVHLRNFGAVSVVIDELAITVLRQAKDFVMSALDATAEYHLPVDGHRYYWVRLPPSGDPVLQW